MSSVPPLPPELWDKTPADVREAILALVLVFEQRIAALEARLGQNSSNSSRPPSSRRPPGQAGRATPAEPASTWRSERPTAQWRRVRDGTRVREWFQREVLPWLREEVHQLLEAVSRCGGVKTASVCDELLVIKSSLWTFASVSGVERTNNAAERAVRHAVCWRKTSHGTDSERGSRFVERMLTVVASCRSQGRGVVEFLTDAITAHQGQSEKPSLIPKRA